MKTHVLLFLVVLWIIATSTISCTTTKNRKTNQIEDKYKKLAYANPIDSIVQVMEDVRTNDDFIAFNRNLEKIYDYLVAHPDFVQSSDSIGRKEYRDENEVYMLWKDCGNIRLYSIPYSTWRGVIYRNIIQFRDNGNIDTSFFEDVIEGLDDLFFL